MFALVVCDAKTLMEIREDQELSEKKDSVFGLESDEEDAV